MKMRPAANTDRYLMRFLLLLNDAVSVVHGLV